MEFIWMDYLEYVGVGLNVIYLVLLIYRSIYCWPFGIAGSALSIFLFLSTKLYSEAILYSFYVVIGFYGWVKWKSNANPDSRVSPIQWSLSNHLKAIGIGVLATLALGSFFKWNSDAERPWADAFSTGFSFVASFLEAKQVLLGWFYWIALNGFSVWLYFDRGLQLYAGLAVVYTVMSFYGYFSWKKVATNSTASDSDALDQPFL